MTLPDTIAPRYVNIIRELKNTQSPIQNQHDTRSPEKVSQ